jgi:competence protein ComEC
MLLGSLIALRTLFHSKRKFLTLFLLLAIFIITRHAVDLRSAILDDQYHSGFTLRDKIKFNSTVEVDEFPNYRFANNQYVLRIKDSNARVLVTAMPYQKFGYSDSLRLTGTLNDIRLQNEEWWPYYRKLGVQYTMFNPQLEKLNVEQRHTIFEKMKIKLFTFKIKLRELVVKKFSSHASALVLGMLLGERDELSKDEKTMFNQAGLSHILVVSGYNISLMITFIFLILKFTSRGIRIGLALVVIFLFVLLVGYEASVVRAALMGSIIIFSKINLRPSSAVNVLFLVATIMLVLNPYSIFDAGFHLSFIATFSLLIMPKMRRIPEFVAVTVWVFLFVLPYIAYLSESVSLAGIVSNIAVTFLLPIFMLGSLVALVLSFLHMPIILDVLLIETMSRYVFIVADLSTRLPSIQIHTPPSLVTAAYLILCTLIIFSMNRYTTDEFMQKHYQKFVPQRSS